MSRNFSDEQLGAILAAAQHVPSRWRNRFLETVAGQFVGREPDDAAVQSAIADAGAKMHINLAGCSGSSTAPCCTEGSPS